MAACGADVTEVGRALGFDLVRYRGWSNPAGLPLSLVEGMDTAVAARIRRLPTDRFVNKWLQIRLGAFQRNRVVDDAVTPDFLRRIDVQRCPVTRVLLTHGEASETDWSIDRINNVGSYSPGNLAVLSLHANRAKGQLSFADVLERSQRKEESAGLSPAEWLRMASTMLGPCFAGRTSHAPLIPLAAPILPCGVLPAVQVVQFVLTTAGSRPAANALSKAFRNACADDYSRLVLEDLLGAMLRGRRNVPVCWDVWLEKDVMRLFGKWRATLDLVSWRRTVQIALALSRSRPVRATRIAAWHLQNGGYAH